MSVVCLPIYNLGAGGERVSYHVPQASLPFPVGPLKPPHALLVLERSYVQSHCLPDTEANAIRANSLRNGSC